MATPPIRGPRRGSRIRRYLVGVLSNLARDAFEVFLMLLALSAGATGLWRPEAVTSPVDHLLPVWGRAIWYGGLLLGATISLLGVTLPVPVGAVVERAGLLVLVGSCLSYAVLALTAGGISQAVLVLVFVVVLLLRIAALVRQPRDIAAAVRLIRSDLDGDR